MSDYFKIFLIVLLFVSPTFAQKKQSSSASTSVDGPSLDETLSFLQRMISESGKATVTVKTGAVDYRQYWQEAVVVGSPTSCIVSWDSVVYAHRIEGHPPPSIKNSSREFLSLKDLRIGDIKVLDLRSWAFSGDQVINQYSHADYSGFVFATNETAGKLSISADSIPNPAHSEVSSSIHHADNRFYFASQSDAERSLKALVHAATICGAKADPF